jgi:hypothetical protein
MTVELLSRLVWLAGAGQLCVLIASALVPARLDWRREFQKLSPLHRQMYWVYGGYVVLSIVAFGLISLTNSAEIAGGKNLARAFCVYVAAFWSIRLCLQPLLKVKEYLTTWWLAVGYHTLTVLFLFFSIVYGLAAFGPRL